MFMVRTMSRWFELLGESQPSAILTPRARNSGMRPCSGTPRPPLAAVTGHIAIAVPVRATASISASSRPRQWATESWRALIPLLWCRVRPVRCSSTTRLSACSRPALHVSYENGIAQARIRPSSRPFHFSMNDVVRATASDAA